RPRSSLHSLVLTIPRPPTSTLFPYTTLFRSRMTKQMAEERATLAKEMQKLKDKAAEKERALKAVNTALADTPENAVLTALRARSDRKSTRLNSSHSPIPHPAFSFHKKHTCPP